MTAEASRGTRIHVCCTVHTGDFLEHGVAHELLEAVGVEAGSVH